MQREVNYSIDGFTNDIAIELTISDKVKIPESAINKVLMTAIKYLVENMETTK